MSAPIAAAQRQSWWPPEPRVVAWVRIAGVERLLEAWMEVGGPLRVAEHDLEVMGALQDQAALLITDLVGWARISTDVCAQQATFAPEARPRVLLLSSNRLAPGVDDTCPPYAPRDVFLSTVRRLLLPRFGMRLPRLQRHAGGDDVLVVRDGELLSEPEEIGDG